MANVENKACKSTSSENYLHSPENPGKKININKALTTFAISTGDCAHSPANMG